MSLELQTVEGLIRSGRFTEAMAALERGPRSGDSRRDSEVWRVELLERLGHHGDCRTWIERLLKKRDLNHASRSICEVSLGYLLWEEGRAEEAIPHFQRAVASAEESKDLFRICWAQIRLLVAVADRTGPQAVAPLLSRARWNAVKLGDPIVSAALHVFVGQMEAKRGLVVSAERHTRVGQRILASAQNIWLESVAENSLVALAIISSDFESGTGHARQALKLAEESGSASMRRASLANLGNLYLLGGHYDKALQLLSSAAQAFASTGDDSNGAYESLARTHFVQGNIAAAAEYLDKIEQSIRTSDDRVLYANRYAQLTRALVLARQGRLADALTRAECAAQLAQTTSDQLLRATAQIAQAEILPRLNRLPDALALLSGLVPHLATLPPDVYAQYERALALALASAGDVAEGQVHLNRARRTFEGLHNAPGQLDAQRVWEAAARASSPGDDVSIAATAAAPAHVLQDLAALLLHAGRPELMARDLVMMLTATHHVASVVAQMRKADGSLHVIAEAHPGPVGATGSRRFALGEARGSMVEVLITPRSGIAAHATINAVALVLGTIQELERSRAEREERLTLWPIEEIPDDDNRAVVAGHMRELMSLARKVAPTTVSVLIRGESGTGKEILARAIHDYSARATKPFVAFNCAAIPRDLLESQLFGHRRGAFTGADRDHPGVIRHARDGTLFLDEIGEMSLDLQPKLLRFLESGEIAPLGETTTPTVDVRIIAATNARLEQLVQEGRFREDLFYRLNVIPLTVLPLRERRDEIPALVHHFLARAATEFMKGRLRVSDEAMEHIVLYRWPGNIRQLQNEIRRMVALAEPDTTITPGALSHDIRRAGPRPIARAASANELSVPLGDKLAPTITRIEREMIQTALKANQGRLEAAAKALGISRKGLYLKRQRFGL